MPGYNRERLLSSFFDNVTFDQVCEVLDKHISNRTPGYMMSLNLDILIRADKDPEFRAALEGADLILMDSAPLMKIARKRGVDCVEKLSGSDLMPRICEFAAKIAVGNKTHSSVMSFANEIGIAPGIVVGRLQKDGYLPYSQLNGLKVRYQFAE